jgi:hypothetical protein
MELHMQSHRWEHRASDWAAAGVAGFFAGAVLMVLELLWSTAATGSDPWVAARMVGAIIQGPDALQTSGFNLSVVIAALATHYVLGIVFGVVLGAIIAPFHLDSSIGMALATGAVFGILIYLLNFYGMQRIFPWFADMRGWPAFFGNVVFGMVAAFAYCKLERTR